MTILFVVFIYLVFHLLCYLLIGRNINILKSEKGIFLYHFASFCIIGVICFWGMLYYSVVNLLIIEISLLALHGVYSLTFLEFWSLSQGGYSISILRLSPIELSDNAGTLRTLEDIGDTKFSERVASLSKIGLLKEQGNLISLTKNGMLATLVLNLFVKLTNRSDRG